MVKPLHLISLLLSLCLAAPLLAAEQPLTADMFMLANISTDGGLSSSRVYSILQADDGAMWISTKRGVDRYNGLSVKNYKLSNVYVYGDASGRIIKLVADSRNRLYAYDNKGKIYLYNKPADQFSMKYNLVDMLGGSMVLNDVVACADGSFYIALDRGVYHLHADGKGSYVFRDAYVHHVALIGTRLVVCTDRGVCLQSAGSASFSNVLPDVAVVTTYYDPATRLLWMGSFHRGVMVYDLRRSRLYPVPGIAAVPHNPVRAIRRLSPSVLLFGVDGGGIYAYDLRLATLSQLFNTGGSPYSSLSGNGIYDICIDRFHNIWSGSYTGGVDYAIAREPSLELVAHEYNNPQSLMDNNVNAVYESADGKMWYATDKGVSIYDPHTRMWHHGLPGKVCITISPSADGKVLVGTYGNGIYTVNADGSATLRYSTANGTLQTDYVYSICLDDEGGLWIGGLDGGMAHISTASIAYVPIREVQCITASPDRRHIVVGTTHGGYLVDRHTHRFSRFFYPDEFPDKDYNFFINALQFNAKGRLDIATDGGGLYVYDFKTRRVVNFTTSDALPSNVICAMNTDRDGRLWLSTDKGLAFVYRHKVTNLNIFKGIDFEYRRMATGKTRNGRLVFGGNDGAVIVTDHLARELDYKAPLHITGINVDGTVCDSAWNARTYAMLQEGKLHFSYFENTPVIHFESVNYKYQHDILYQYYLEGYDRDWSLPSTLQTARYVYLVPGHYIFHVRSVSKSNGRVLGTASFHIYISQPWWNSWWAWLVYLALLSAVAYMAWRYYKQQLQRRYYDEKINFFVNTAHNIRTPLSLVLAPLRDLANEPSLSDKARRFLDLAQRNGDKLLRMVTELLDFQRSEQTGRKLKLQAADLAAILRVEIDKFATLAADKHVSLKLLSCPHIAFLTDIPIFDLIFENLLSNAVKYTPEGGSVDIWSEQADKHIKIFVKDTGIGIPNSDKDQIFQSFFRASNAVSSQEMGSGLGLMLTRQLVEKLKGTLTFKSVENQGTTFLVSLPLLASAAPTPAGLAMLRVAPEKPAEATQVPLSPVGDDAGDADRLLFVDDNADLRTYVQMAYAQRYRVAVVGSADEALRWLHDNECDIVVSDVMMPGMQGDELCRRLKHDDNTSWLPVILLTAKSGRDFMIGGLHLGADDYIAKPFDPEVLAGKIDSILANRRRLGKYYMARAVAMAGMSEPQSVAEPSLPSGAAVQLSDEGKLFVDNATRVVMANISDADFSIDRLCREVMMSRTLLYGKLKGYTGKSPQDFIRIIRLEQAAVLLRQGKSVLDVSVATGFTNVKYFSTVFKKHFGVSPSKY